MTATPDHSASPAYFWISFYIPDQHFGEFELHSPWWVSGYGDDMTIVVAAVHAKSERDAWKVIDNAFDDEPHYDERFVEWMQGDVSPFSERFPRAAWMRWSA